MTPRVQRRELDDLLMLTDEIEATIQQGREPSAKIVDAAIEITREIARDNTGEARDVPNRTST